MKTLNVAVIGAGNMGRHHIRHYYQLPTTSLVAIVDPSPEVGAMYSTQYECKHYTTIEDLINNENIDAVSIAAPTSLHVKTASFFLEKGVHVLVEKPISETPEEADYLIQLAESHNATLMVGHIERFNPAVVALKQMISDGKFGQITSIQLSRMSMMPTQIKDANVFIDLAVHDIDLSNYLLNETPSSIYSNSNNALLKDRTDFADIFMTYPSRASASIHVNWICPTRVRTLKLLGTNGYAEVDLMEKKGYYIPSHYTYNDVNIPQFSDSIKEEITIIDGDALQEQLKHFIACIQNTTPPITSGLAGKKALQLALQAQQF